MTSRLKWFQFCGIGGAAMAVLTIGHGAAMAETLEEALAKAYMNNPTLLAARAELRAVDEGVPQALSGWRPTLEFSYDVGKEHVDSNTTTSGTQNRTPKSAAVSVDQNLFNGFRTVSATQEAEANVKAQRGAPCGDRADRDV